MNESSRRMNNNNSLKMIRVLPDCCKLCRGREVLLFCTPALGFGLCGHISCQSCFTLKNKTKVSKSYSCPVCMGPFYYSLSSLAEAIMIGVGAYYHFCSSRCEMKVGDNDEYTFSTKQLDNFESLIVSHPNSICGLIFLISSLSSVVNIAERVEPDLYDNDKITLFCKRRPEITSNITTMYKCCLNLLDMTDHESSFLFTTCLDIYYCHIGHAFAINSNTVMSFKYSKLAYAFALRCDRPQLINQYKRNLMLMKSKLDVLPPMRFVVGDKVLCRDKEADEWRSCEVVELHYRERDDPLHYCAPYRVKGLAGDDCPGEASSDKGGDDVPVYLTVEDDSDALVRRPGWISLEAARFEARLDAKVDELLAVYCSPEFIQGIYRTLRADEAFCARLHEDWQLEFSEHVLYLFRMLIMYRQPLVRTDSGYHIPTADEVIAGIREFFYSDTAAGLEDKMESGCSDCSVILKMADSLVLRFPPMAFDHYSPSSDMYLNIWLPEGLVALTLSSYLSMYSEEVHGHDDVIALIQHGFSKFIPVHLVPSQEAMQLITACKSAGHFLQLFDQLSLLGVDYLVISMYQFVFDLVVPRQSRSKSFRESPMVFFFVKYCIDQGLGVPGPLLAAYNDMRGQLSCGFLRCANPTCEHNKLDKSTGKVKFKKCSRCQTVIYCSRECQVAHYPNHKAHCWKVTSAERSASHTAEHKSDDHAEEEEE